MGGVLAVTLRYARISAQHTPDMYIYEQARLIMDSAIEKTLLAISAKYRGSDKNSMDCLSEYTASIDTGRGRIYTVKVRVIRYYLYEGSCATVANVSIGDEDSHGMVLLEAEVNATVGGRPVARILRRSLLHP